MTRPQLDEARAHEFIGKTILVGVTNYDHDDNLMSRQEYYGTIETYSNTEGVRIKLFGSDDHCCLPPDPGGIQEAEPGVYTLKSTGQQIEDPDYLATLSCTLPEPESVE